jgi:hypothetical protein
MTNCSTANTEQIASHLPQSSNVPTGGNKHVQTGLEVEIFCSQASKWGFRPDNMKNDFVWHWQQRTAGVKNLWLFGFAGHVAIFIMNLSLPWDWVRLQQGVNTKTWTQRETAAVTYWRSLQPELTDSIYLFYICLSLFLFVLPNHSFYSHCSSKVQTSRALSVGIGHKWHTFLSGLLLPTVPLLAFQILCQDFLIKEKYFRFQ